MDYMTTAICHKCQITSRTSVIQTLKYCDICRYGFPQFKCDNCAMMCKMCCTIISRSEALKRDGFSKILNFNESINDRGEFMEDDGR